MDNNHDNDINDNDALTDGWIDYTLPLAQARRVIIIVENFADSANCQTKLATV